MKVAIVTCHPDGWVSLLNCNSIRPTAVIKIRFNFPEIGAGICVDAFPSCISDKTGWSATVDVTTSTTTRRLHCQHTGVGQEGGRVKSIPVVGRWLANHETVCEPRAHVINFECPRNRWNNNKKLKPILINFNWIDQDSFNIVNHSLQGVESNNPMFWLK